MYAEYKGTIAMKTYKLPMQLKVKKQVLLRIVSNAIGFMTPKHT